MFFFFQAEDGIRDLVRSRGLGDVYKRQTFTDLKDCPETLLDRLHHYFLTYKHAPGSTQHKVEITSMYGRDEACLLYTSDAADERSSVDLGGRRIIKKKNMKKKKNLTHTTLKYPPLFQQRLFFIWGFW